MKTITDIMKEIIGGLMPRTETGCITAMIALCMAYDGRM